MPDRARVIEWISAYWRHPLQFLLIALTGAGFAFAYSYGPLHRGKNWEIDYLQDRVDAQNVKLRELELQLSQSESDVASQPDPEVVAEQQKEVSSTRRELEKVKAELARSEKTIASLRSSISQWKTRHEGALAELESARSAKARPEPEEPKPVVARAKPAEEKPAVPAEQTPSVASGQVDRVLAGMEPPAHLLIRHDQESAGPNATGRRPEGMQSAQQPTAAPAP